MCLVFDDKYLVKVGIMLANAKTKIIRNLRSFFQSVLISRTVYRLCLNRNLSDQEIKRYLVSLLISA